MYVFVDQTGRENLPPSVLLILLYFNTPLRSSFADIFVFHEEAVHVNIDDAIWTVCEKTNTRVHFMLISSCHVKKLSLRNLAIGVVALGMCPHDKNSRVGSVKMIGLQQT